MKPSQILPVVMIALSLGSSIGYALEGDWRHVVYWLAASLLTASVTF